MPIYCIYDGISNFDPKLEVLSFLYAKSSSNRKIGNQVHYTITIPKHEDSKAQDSSTCNNCPLLYKGCYVNGIMKASYYKWKRMYNEGLIQFLDVQSAEGRNTLKQLSYGFKLRFNVTGDPLAIPYEINKSLIGIYKKYIMYSHFRYLDERYKDICLQSTETYIRKGNTARIIPFTVEDLKQDKQKVMSYVGRDEVICPAQTKGLNCSVCSICESKRSVVFLAHGSGKNRIAKSIPEMEF